MARHPCYNYSINSIGFADDVNMVEFEGRIAHRFSLACEIGRGDQLSGWSISFVECYAP